MAQAITLTFDTGILVITTYPGGDEVESIPLDAIIDTGTAEWTRPDEAKALGDEDFNGVVINYLRDGEKVFKRIDIGDVDDGTTYLTKEALKTAIDNAIAA